MPAAAGALPIDPADMVYIIETLAGNDLVGDGGLASEAQIGDARSVTVDHRGNIYVADTANHRVRKVTPEGLISTVAGTGRPGYSGDGGPGEAAQLNGPYGVAVDPGGNLYIADTYNHTVRKVDQNGRIITAAGNGLKGSGETGDPLTTQLMAPRNVACDSAGNVYIAEFEGHRVRKLTVATGQIMTVAGNGVAGYGGDNASAVAAQLDHPAGIAVDRAGVLYIADTGNRRLRRVSAGSISTLLQMEWSDGITAVAVDPTGAVVVADRPNLIRQLSGKAWSVIGGTGKSTYNGDGSPALVTNLAPTGLAFDSAGNLFVTEKKRVRKIVAGLVYTVAGDGTFRFRGDDGPATLARLNEPTGLVLDPQGNLYVSDTGNQRIRKIDTAGNITTVAGTGMPGNNGVNGPAVETPLGGPEGLAFDDSGNLVIADRWNCRVLKLLPGGILQLVASRCGSGTDENGAGESIPLFHPRAVASDKSGYIYVSETERNRVLKISPNGSIVTFAGNGSRGYAGDGGRASAAQLDGPAGLTLDAEGNLYIADANNNRIRKVSAAGFIETVAGTGDAQFSGDGGPARLASLNQPVSVALDRAANLYIADTMNQRVRKVTRDGVIETIAGNGQQGYEGDGGVATAARLFHPGYLAADAEGNLYFTDQFNHRVRVLRPHSILADPQTLTVTNAATMRPGPVAPGEIVSVFGAAIGPESGLNASLRPDGLVATMLGESQVLFDGRPAPLFWVGRGQINAQAPYAIAGQKETVVEVIHKGYLRGKAVLPVAEAAPGVFAIPGDAGRGVIINEDWSVNSPANPAKRNSLVTLYATGEGETAPSGAEGKPAGEPYPRPRLPVYLTIGGLPAEILYAGAAPGFCGLMQINARVPGGFLPSGVLQVVLTVGTAESQPGVSIAVQ